MSPKQTQGDNRQRRAQAKKARDAGLSASEVGASTSASKQIKQAKGNASHQEKIDTITEGKLESARKAPDTRPASGIAEQEPR